MMTEAFDPIVFIPEPDVHDHIFKYVSGSDVMTLMSVSKTWKDTVLRSSVAMRKIKLVVTDAHPEIKSLLDAKKFLAGRIYRHARVVFFREDKKSEKMDLLKILAPNLRELELTGSPRVGLALPLEFKFPKLKKLTIGNFRPRDALNVLSMTTDSLEELIFFRIEGLFYQPVSAISAKLTSLRFEIIPLFADEDEMQNIKTFIRMMSSTLKFLKINWCSFEMFEFSMTLPFLKSLQVSMFHFNREQKFTSNESITTFIWEKPGRRLPENVLNSMKNLQIVELLSGDKVSFESAVLTSHKMRTEMTIKVHKWQGSVSCPCSLYADLIESYSTQILLGIKIVHGNFQEIRCITKTQ